MNVVNGHHLNELFFLYEVTIDGKINSIAPRILAAFQVSMSFLFIFPALLNVVFTHLWRQSKEILGRIKCFFEISLVKMILSNCYKKGR